MVRGLMGGTFDPIHLGHLLIASAALEEMALDSVLFLPDGDPPHKQPHSAPRHRLRMAQLACEGEPRFQVSDMELRRHGRTYTVDTLLALKAMNPAEDLVYLEREVWYSGHTMTEDQRRRCLALLESARRVWREQTPALRRFAARFQLVKKAF